MKKLINYIITIFRKKPTPTPKPTVAFPYIFPIPF